MTPEVALDVFREALWIIVTLVMYIVGPSLIVGLIVSIFQAATQINEQTLSFLPRLMVILIILIAGGPYMLGQVMDYTLQLYARIPYLIG